MNHLEMMTTKKNMEVKNKKIARCIGLAIFLCYVLDICDKVFLPPSINAEAKSPLW